MPALVCAGFYAYARKIRHKPDGAFRDRKIDAPVADGASDAFSARRDAPARDAGADTKWFQIQPSAGFPDTHWSELKRRTRQGKRYYPQSHVPWTGVARVAATRRER